MADNVSRPKPTAAEPPKPTAAEPPKPTAAEPPKPTAAEPPKPTAGEPPKPEGLILHQKDPKTKIATITFNRPEDPNAPTSAAPAGSADLHGAAPLNQHGKGVVVPGA